MLDANGVMLGKLLGWVQQPNVSAITLQDAGGLIWTYDVAGVSAEDHLYFETTDCSGTPYSPLFSDLSVNRGNALARNQVVANHGALYKLVGPTSTITVSSARFFSADGCVKFAAQSTGRAVAMAAIGPSPSPVPVPFEVRF